MPLSATFIQQMYVAYFGRPADPGGLAFYASSDEDTLVRAFAASPESGALYGSGGTASFISAVYRHLFNREVEAAGLAAWTAQVTSGQLGSAGIALAILRGARNDDLATVSNKVTAAAEFSARVDTAAEITGYAGTAAAAVARGYLQGVGSTGASLNTALAGADKAVLDATVPPAPTPATPAPAPVPGALSLVLTAGADNLTGTAMADTFTGSSPGFFGTGDSLDGGGGLDTLTVTGETATITGTGISVANIETASLTTTGGINLNTTGWTGLTTLAATGTGALTLTAGAGVDTTATTSARGAGAVVVNGGGAVTVNATGSTTGTITVGVTTAPTGAIVVSNTSTGTVGMGAITITGGTTVNVSQVATNAVNTTTTTGTVTVNGKADTTAVTVLNTPRAVAAAGTAGVNNNTVAINDLNAGSATLASSITSATVRGYTTLAIASNALSSLSLASGSSNVTITNGGLTVPSTRTLGLTLDATTGGTVADAEIYTALNITLAGDATLFRLDLRAVTTASLSGSGILTLSASTIGLGAMQTLTISGSAGLNTAGNLFGLTSLDTSASTGTNTLLLNPNVVTVTSGAGVENFTLSSNTISKAIDLGGGDDSLVLATSGAVTVTAAIDGGLGTDTIEMTPSRAAGASTNGLKGNVSGFEILSLAAAATGANVVDVFDLGSSIHTVQVARTADLTLNNFPANGTLLLTALGAKITVGNTTAGTGFGGNNDLLNLRLSNSGSVIFTSGTDGLTLTGIEKLAITTVDTRAAPVTINTHTLALGAANTLESITVAGNASLSLTAASTTLTTLDASGITIGGLTWTSGALAGAAVVKGAASGANSINTAAALGGITYTGGSGADVLTVGRGTNSIDVGTGTDQVNVSAITSASNSSLFTSITGMSAGDKVSIAATDTRAAPTSVAAKTTGQTTLQGYLDAATAADGSGTLATPALYGWFQFGGDTYLVRDATAASTFASTDTVVRIVGTFDLGAAAISGGVLTLA